MSFISHAPLPGPLHDEMMIYRDTYGAARHWRYGIMIFRYR